MNDKMNIHEKIFAIYTELEPYIKQDKEGHKYNYVSSEKLIPIIKAKLVEYRLRCNHGYLQTKGGAIGYEKKVDSQTINKKDRTITEETQRDTWFFTEGIHKFTWINIDNPEEIFIEEIFGAGENTSPSKACGSGMTYNKRRYFLETFYFSTGDEDPDSNQGNNEKQTINNLADKINGMKEKKEPVKKVTDEELFNHLKLISTQQTTGKQKPFAKKAFKDYKDFMSRARFQLAFGKLDESQIKTMDLIFAGLVAAPQANKKAVDKTNVFFKIHSPKEVKSE